MDCIKKPKKDFVLEYNTVSARFKPSEIFNTDQIDAEKKCPSTQMTSFSGEKETFVAIQSKSATIHSYTLKPTVSLDGRLLETIYLCLQEQGSKLWIKQISKNIICAFSRLFKERWANK